ncbi:MAG: heme o synthase [Planctomycetota bacterium]
MSTLISKTEEHLSNPAVSRRQAYVELTKLRISVMVLFTFAVAALLSASLAGTSIGLATFCCALMGMLSIASSGNAMNMYIERYSDSLMARTKGRPLPAQRLSSTEVATFGAVSFGVGVAFLLAGVNWQTALCGVANWILYVFIYTPLKRRTPWNTEIGSIAGAMPVMMGCLAAIETVDLVGWAFFWVLVLWQFPHFMAIAWKYRHQYRDGGLKMITVTDPTGYSAGRKSVVTGVLLILVSLLPVVALPTLVHKILFGLIATALGIYYLKPAIRFWQTPKDETARSLMLASLVYLPLYMMLLLAGCLI